MDAGIVGFGGSWIRSDPQPPGALRLCKLAQRAVELELLLGEQGQFGDSRRGARLRRSGRAGRAGGARWRAPESPGWRSRTSLASGGLTSAEQGLGQQGALGRVFDHVHGVAGLAAGERLQGREGAKMLKPSGLLGEGLGGEAAGALDLGVGDGEGAEQDPLDFSEGGGASFDVVAAAESGLAQLFAQDGRVDAQLLRGVGGKLVAGQLLRHAADVRQQEVHGLDLLLGAGAGEHLPGALDEVVGLAARAAHGRGVGLDAALADEAVGVEAAVEGDDLDGEALFGEQGDGFFGGVGAGGVGIEVDDDVARCGA